MNNAVPLWATILIAFGVALLTLIGVLVTQAVLRKNAKETNQVARSNAQDTTQVARRAMVIDQSKSDREMILEALKLERDADPRAQRQGRAILEGLLRMPGLSEGDAVLVQQVTRPEIGRILDEGQRVQQETGAPPEFYVSEE